MRRHIDSDNDDNDEDDECEGSLICDIDSSEINHKNLVGDQVNGFSCPLCQSRYTTRQNLVKHIRQQKTCQVRQELNNILQKSALAPQSGTGGSQESSSSARSPGEAGGSPRVSPAKKNTVKVLKSMSPVLTPLTGSREAHRKSIPIAGIAVEGTQPIIIQNQHNNIQQNHIQQNIQNNVQENKNQIHIGLPNDFLHDIYDHTHLDYRALSTDFYLLQNFLTLMLQNTQNQNILFLEDDPKNAIIYTRDHIRRIPNEKAGYVVLEKLYKTMEDLITHVVHDEDKRAEFKYMTRYYRILLNKYKADTLFKEYNAESRAFEHTSHGNLLRSRDEYLGDMIAIVSKYHDSIKETIFQNVDHNHIPKTLINVDPNVDGFTSRRLRYRN